MWTRALLHNMQHSVRMRQIIKIWDSEHSWVHGRMYGWMDGVIWSTDSFRDLPPVLYKHRKSPSLSLFSLSWHHNYLQVQWISRTVAPVLLSSQRRNLIHVSVEMIRRVFIKPTCTWLVGTVSDGLFVNCVLTCVTEPKWDTFGGFGTDI